MESLAGKRILVVDDDPMVRESIGFMLEPDGYVLEFAESGFAALDRFESSRFDLVLTDNRMAGMTGMQLARQIKTRSSAQKIILFSGSPPSNAAPDYEMILLKPFSPADLRLAVSDVIRKSKPGTPPPASC